VGSVKDCRDLPFPGNGSHTPPLPKSPTGFLPLEKVPDIMKFFIMVQSLSLYLIGYEWCKQVASRSFSK
jgi:hypothetical protein